MDQQKQSQSKRISKIQLTLYIHIILSRELNWLTYGPRYKVKDKGPGFRVPGPPVSLFQYAYSCNMQLKPIFIQKEVRTLVFFPDIYLKFLTTTFLNRKKALL